MKPSIKIWPKFYLGGVEGTADCRDFPNLMSRFALSRYCLSEADLEGPVAWHRMLDVDHALGLRQDMATKLFPPSAYQGPFLSILKLHPEIGLQLVLSVVNHAADWYGQRKSCSDVIEPAFHITLSVPGHGDVVQWANDRLWMAYRGTSVTPNVVQCALMALEMWLLELCENAVPAESWLTKLLVESNNVMTTAVVASVCNAYPTAGGAAAFALLSSREVFLMDLRRMVKEHDAVALAAFPNVAPMHRLFRSEREQSNALEHRGYHLETLACQLQFAGKSREVWEILARIHRWTRTEGVRTQEGGVRKLQTRWPGLEFG